MPRLVAEPQRNAHDIRSIFGLIGPDLERVEKLLIAELHSDAPYVDALLSYVAGLGGKRLRPALVLLTGHALGRVTPAHDVVAAVMEMIHTATLVHDDILDEATSRRHHATVHRRWGTHAAVLLGDHLFTHAFYLASTLDDPFACRTIGKSTNLVCDGELRQVGTRGQLRLSEEEYLSVIGSKTAELCACCCLLGAHYAGGDAATCRNLQGFGYELGVAFQIADDVLDLVGDPRAVGKTLGTDWATEKPTLPVIHYLSGASSAEESDFLAAVGHAGHRPDLEKLRRLLDASGSIEYSRKLAVEYSQRARKRLHALPESQACRALDTLSELVISRHR